MHKALLLGALAAFLTSIQSVLMINDLASLGNACACPSMHASTNILSMCLLMLEGQLLLGWGLMLISFLQLSLSLKFKFKRVNRQPDR